MLSPLWSSRELIWIAVDSKTKEICDNWEVLLLNDFSYGEESRDLHISPFFPVSFEKMVTVC